MRLVYLFLTFNLKNIFCCLKYLNLLKLVTQQIWNLIHSILDHLNLYDIYLRKAILGFTFSVFAYSILGFTLFSIKHTSSTRPYWDKVFLNTKCIIFVKLYVDDVCKFVRKFRLYRVNMFLQTTTITLTSLQNFHRAPRPPAQVHG